MTNSNSLRRSAFALARAYSAARGLPIRLVFEGSLLGDLARMHLFQRLRVAFPVTPISTVEELIEEDFTP
jgi:hypothetical protein